MGHQVSAPLPAAVWTESVVAALNQSGAGWITTTMLAGRRVLRVAVMNPRTTPDDMQRTLDRLAATGADLAHRWSRG
jgi:aromatic-L-amino-acid/L-tryptophan decarboxylase